MINPKRWFNKVFKVYFLMLYNCFLNLRSRIPVKYIYNIYILVWEFIGQIYLKFSVNTPTVFLCSKLRTNFPVNYMSNLPVVFQWIILNWNQADVQRSSRLIRVIRRARKTKIVKRRLNAATLVAARRAVNLLKNNLVSGENCKLSFWERKTTTKKNMCSRRNDVELCSNVFLKFKKL